MVKVNVKWGKQSYSVDVDVTAPVEAFKVQLQSLTNVPADKQKIMGVKGGTLKDDANLADLGLKEGQQLLLIGSAIEAVVAVPDAPVVFAEDQKGTSTNSSTSNGLVNLANTCYLNSALQVLRVIPQVRPVLAMRGAPLSTAVGKLFSELDGTRDAVKPLGVWTALMSQYPEFARTGDHGHPMQHDSQEALGGILSNINQTIATTPECSQLLNLTNGSFIQTRSRVGEDDATPAAQNTVDFSIFTVNLTPGLSTLEMNMHSSLKGTMAATTDGQEVVYNTTSQFSKLPEYLFVQLARFTWRNDTKNKTKILAQINLPFVLDVNSMCTDELKAKMEAERVVLKERRDKEVERRKRAKQRTRHDDEDDNAAPIVDTEPAVVGNTNGYYELCGVISHKGRDADGGHYVAWAKKNGSWLVFDDANVAPVTEQNITDLSGGPPEAHMAYILLYRARDPSTFAPPLLL